MKVRDKASILNTLYVHTSEREEWAEFFKWATLGVPASIMLTAGYFDSTGVSAEVEELINETYTVLLNVLDLPDVEYDSLTELFEAALKE